MAKRTKVQTMPFEVHAAAQFEQLLRDELPGFSICPYPRYISIGTRETYPDLLPGVRIMDVGGECWNQHDQTMRELVDRRLPDGELKSRLARWTYKSLTPGGPPNPSDIPNPRQYLLDGAMIPDDRLVFRDRMSSAAFASFRFFRKHLSAAWSSPMNLRKAKVVEYLDHHFDNGGNPKALVDHVEGLRPNTPLPEGLQKALATWTATARLRLGDSIGIARVVMNGIRDEMGLPPAPKVMPPASSIWQGRTVVDAFEQLKHEAHYCLLSLLRDSAAEVEAYRLMRNRTLKAYRPPLEAKKPEDDGYINKLGNQRRELAAQWYHAGGSPLYGLTMKDNGAKSGSLIQRWGRWIDAFVAEVTAAYSAYGRSAQAAKELKRLASGIAQLSIGAAERKAYEERLELAKQDLSNRGQYAAPGDIAAMFHGHIQGFNSWSERLLERVSAIVVGGAGVSVLVKTGTMPTQPTLASKFAAVPGSMDKWMALLRSEGLVDEGGRFTMASGDKGKGKLIAAWVAAVEVFGLAGYSHGTKLVKALIDHFDGLTGLDRLDKIRKTKDFTPNVERYKEELQDD